jgi:hypothetical protein
MAKRVAFFFVVLFLIALTVVEALSGSATSGQLNANEAIRAYPCVDGKTSYVAKTGLTSCVVSRDTDFGEARVPSGSAIYLKEDGKPFSVFLSHDTTIRGYTCLGGHGHGYSTGFYPSGELKLCWLASDQEVDGIPCMQASFFADVVGGTVGTHFYRSGKLRTCKISRDAVIQDRKFRQGDHIYLDADGRVQQK